MSDPELEILDRSLDHGGRILSPLTRWMVEHHDDFAALLARKGVNWRKLCRGFAELGLTNADGKPLTARTARETWFRARKLVVRRRLSPSGAPAATAPAPSAGGNGTPASGSTSRYVAVDPEFSVGEDESEFRPVAGRLKRLAPSSPLVAAAQHTADGARAAATRKQTAPQGKESGNDASQPKRTGPAPR